MQQKWFQWFIDVFPQHARADPRHCFGKAETQVLLLVVLRQMNCLRFKFNQQAHLSEHMWTKVSLNLYWPNVDFHYNAVIARPARVSDCTLITMSTFLNHCRIRACIIICSLSRSRSLSLCQVVSTFSAWCDDMCLLLWLLSPSGPTWFIQITPFRFYTRSMLGAALDPVFTVMSYRHVKQSSLRWEYLCSAPHAPFPVCFLFLFNFI